MSQLTKPLALALVLGMAHGAYAQDSTDSTTATSPATTADQGSAPAASGSDATTPAADATTPAAPADDKAAPAAPAGNAPQQAPQDETYTKATYGDWALQCIKAKDGKDPCQIYQVIKGPGGGNIADISLFGLPKGGKAEAGATIMVPLDTLLTQNLTVQVDKSDPRVYPFTFCQPMGCFARIGLTSAEVNAYKKGGKATISIVPLAAPDKKVSADISLNGFTDAYNAVVKANEESGALK
ncbi:invasion associated locus B family protein [Thioclava sp. BHET1]|nr:invasion associated locus B family protein [Thioclava sp. BHET1]